MYFRGFNFFNSLTLGYWFSRTFVYTKIRNMKICLNVDTCVLYIKYIDISIHKIFTLVFFFSQIYHFCIRLYARVCSLLYIYTTKKKWSNFCPKQAKCSLGNILQPILKAMINSKCFHFENITQTLIWGVTPLFFLIFLNWENYIHIIAENYIHILRKRLHVSFGN